MQDDPSSESRAPRGFSFEIDILVALYGNYLNVNPEQPKWSDRDRFILSKGHASPGMYAILSEMGFIEHHDLDSYRVKEEFVKDMLT